MRVLSFLAVAAVISIPAYAADAVIYYDPTPDSPVASAFAWTGGYIGANAGGAFGKFKLSGTEIEDYSESISNELGITAGGFVGGVQAGYNWQDAQLIYGVEADIQATTLRAELTTSSYEEFWWGHESSTDTIGVKIPWYGTLRARLGYTPTDRFMVYGTGGLAYGSIKAYSKGSWEEIEYDEPEDNDGDTYSESATKTKVGYTIGGGFEYAFTNNWTLKSEYLYTDLGTAKFDIDGETARVKAPFHTVRFGFNYKF